MQIKAHPWCWDSVGLRVRVRRGQGTPMPSYPLKTRAGVAIGLGVPYVFEGLFPCMFNQLLRSCIAFYFGVLICLLFKLLLASYSSGRATTWRSPAHHPLGVSFPWVTRSLLSIRIRCVDSIINILIAWLLLLGLEGVFTLAWRCCLCGGSGITSLCCASRLAHLPALWVIDSEVRLLLLFCCRATH